jgi:hypothetical protein
MNIQYSEPSAAYVIDDPDRFRVSRRAFVDLGVLESASRLERDRQRLNSTARK